MIDRFDIPRAILIELKDKLSYEELGVALALLMWQADTKTGLPDDERTHKQIKVHASRWKRIREKLVPYFDIEASGRWQHRMFAEYLRHKSDADSTVPDEAFNYQRLDGRLFMTAPSIAQGRRRPNVKRPTQNPGQGLLFGARDLVTKDAKPSVTLKQEDTLGSYAIRLGLDVFDHLDEARGRKLLGSFLRDYSAPYVVQALELARDRKGSLADSVSWVKRTLMSYPTKEEEKRDRFAHIGKLSGAAQVRKEVEKNDSVRPDRIDVSEQKARKLKQLAARVKTFNFNPDS